MKQQTVETTANRMRENNESKTNASEKPCPLNLADIGLGLAALSAPRIVIICRRAWS